MQGDQVGSPNILTNASGAVVGRSKNLPFGERFGSSGEKASRRYTNHEDQDGSAIYMQARTYLPIYGKFAQVDPAYDQTKDDPESWNLYNYVTNNPVTHTDPDGRATAQGIMGVRYILDGVSLGGNLMGLGGYGEWNTAPFGGVGPLAIFDFSGMPLVSVEATTPNPDTQAGSKGAKTGFYRVTVTPDDKGGIAGVSVDTTTVAHVSTSDAAVNGMSNSLQRAAELAAENIRSLPNKRNVTSFTLFYNPDRGFFGGLWSSLMDKLGFSTSQARMLSAELKDIASRGQHVDWVVHSQGSAIFSEAVRISGGGLSGARVAIFEEP